LATLVLNLDQSHACATKKANDSGNERCCGGANCHSVFTI
jgi:hypothetical protein